MLYECESALCVRAHTSVWFRPFSVSLLITLGLAREAELRELRAELDFL